MPTSAVRRTRRLVLVVLVGATLAVGALAGPPEHGVHHLPPVPGEVWRPYEPPGSAYGPGHRGVDLGAEPGEPVRASAVGVVVHAGAIAGTTWVSIDHADGLRTAYGPLAALRVTAGQHVDTAEAIGTLASAGHGHEGRDRGLHFSVRRDGDYLDPLGLLTSGGVPSLHGPGRIAPQPGAPHTAVERPHGPRDGPRDRLAVPGLPTSAASTR